MGSRFGPGFGAKIGLLSILGFLRSFWPKPYDLEALNEGSGRSWKGSKMIFGTILVKKGPGRPSLLEKIWSRARFFSKIGGLNPG